MPFRRRDIASARALLRAFQQIRGDRPDPAFMADLDYVQHKDLDLSVRLGAMLAADALAISAAINPIAASPGAPLSLDAPTHPWEVAAVCIGILLLAWAAFECVRAVLIGEEFEIDEPETDPQQLARRLFAAYCRSVDAQGALLVRAVRLTVLGGIVTLASWGWILIDKITA